VTARGRDGGWQRHESGRQDREQPRLRGSYRCARPAVQGGDSVSGRSPDVPA